MNSGAGLRLETVVRPAQELIDDFNAKKQIWIFYEFEKKKLKNDEVIVFLDFSENLSFEVQFQAQSYYYSKPQCTIHTFCLYYRDGNEQKNKSIIIIAESL